MRALNFAALALAGSLYCLPASAAEFRSIGDNPAILFDAPSQKANKVSILGRNYPVEVLVKLEKMTKVRDIAGDMGWVDNPLLTDRRLLIVAAASGEVRTQPNPAAPLVFEAVRLVILEPAGPSADGWLPVRHRDGQQGYIKSSQVWGE
jgi:SH3-like domain-containing protein